MATGGRSRLPWPMDDLMTLATEWDRSADELRRRAGLVRATADLRWQGPAAGAYRAHAVERWAALNDLAARMDRVAGALRALSRLREAA